jgi:hypothetical protein
MTDAVVVGIDVAKDTVAVAVRPAGTTWSAATTPVGLHEATKSTKNDRRKTRGFVLCVLCASVVNKSYDIISSPAAPIDG